MFFQGINLSGLEASGSTSRGRHGFDYKSPTASHYDYWFGEGDSSNTAMNIVRLPFKWERLQTELYGDLDKEYLGLIKEQVAFAEAKGADIILDVHNLARYAILNNDGTETAHYIGSEEVPAEAFEDLWRKLASEFKEDDHVVLGLMNEPTNHYSGEDWADIAQGAIDVIRETGSDNKILVPGVFWSSAQFWNSHGNGDALAGITDPSDNIVFETHQYFDVDGSGRTDIVGDDAVSRLQAVTDWARETGNKVFLGEFGIGLDNPETAEHNAALMKDVMTFMVQNADVWEGWAAWGAGEFWKNDYHFKLTQDSITGAEQSEAAWLKSMAELYIYETTPTESLWNKTQQNLVSQNSFEAENLDLSGAYRAVTTRDASGGKAILSYGGEGAVTLEFAGQTGYYQLKTDYFDESDGISTFKISVNGTEVQNFTADQDLNNILRSKSNLVSHMSNSLYLEEGDEVTVTSARHRGELAAIDALHLVGNTGTLGDAGIRLTGLTQSDITDYDFRQNDGSAIVTAGEDGRSISIDGNGWAAVDIDYDFTEHTVVSVNMTLKNLGEIHGVAFDTDHKMTAGDIFQFAGTQNYGHNLKSDVGLDGGRGFTFHAGDYFTGTRSVMGFIGDDDNASDGLGHAIFDDIHIYELTSSIYGSESDDIIIGTDNAEYLYGGQGADIFALDSTSLDLADKLMDFDSHQGDRLDVSGLADDLGISTDLLLQNMSLVTDSAGQGSLLLNEGAVTGSGNKVTTLALFNSGTKGLDIGDIV